MLIVRRTALATVLALSLAGTARAADAPAPEGTPWYQQPLVLVGGAVKAVGNVAGSMWADRSADRHSSEFAANASIASAVSTTALDGGVRVMGPLAAYTGRKHLAAHHA